METKKMENKKLIITFIWIFTLATIVILALEGIIIEFVGYLMFFFIALGSTVAVETMLTEKKKPEGELLSELQDIRSRLDELKKSNP
jgi:hypothetical protein